MNCPSDRAEKLRRVQELHFMADELRLFLDTHPQSQEATAYLKRYTTLLRAARRAFEEIYGPLTPDAFADQCTYNWTDRPWPWEAEA